MKKSQAGFTLIELVMVIVILGVLAAVAIPKFIDMRGDANTAAINSVAGSLSAAAATNYAARTAGGTGKGYAVTDCKDVGKALQSYSGTGTGDTALPTNGGTYAITSAAISTGESVTCTLTFTPNSGTTTPITAPFTGIGIP